MESITITFYDKHGAADLYRDMVSGRIYARQPAGGSKEENLVSWSTTTPAYEPDLPIREGTVMRVVDNSQEIIPLFAERLMTDIWNGVTTARKIGNFSYEDEKMLARQWAQDHQLHSYEDWKTFAEAGKPEGSSTDEWLYCETDSSERRSLTQVYSLGRDLAIMEQTVTHRINGKAWKYVFLATKSGDVTLAICGYSWEEK